MTYWIIASGVELALIIGLGVWLIVSRRQLAGARRELRHARRDTPIRRLRRGIAPVAIRAAFNTTDSLIKKGFGATVRNSVEDLAGWASVERPDLARMTADGDIVVMFSDIEGSTARNEELGDRAWLKLLERHNKLTSKHVEAHGGQVVKNQGDGFMLAFSDPAQAVRCGVRIQEALLDKPDRWKGIRVRMGVHTGSSVRRGDDLFGLNIAMAARVAAQADGGEILVSEPVHIAVSEADDLRFGAPREAQLKGIKGGHKLYPVELPTLALAENSVQELE